LCDGDVRQSRQRFSQRFQTLKAASAASVYDTVVLQIYRDFRNNDVEWCR
jgi:hypothetical protein